MGRRSPRLLCAPLRSLRLCVIFSRFNARAVGYDEKDNAEAQSTRRFLPTGRQAQRKTPRLATAF
jgi:hypothetical protein